MIIREAARSDNVQLLQSLIRANVNVTDIVVDYVSNCV